MVPQLMSDWTPAKLAGTLGGINRSINKKMAEGESTADLVEARQDVVAQLERVKEERESGKSSKKRSLRSTSGESSKKRDRHNTGKDSASDLFAEDKGSAVAGPSTKKRRKRKPTMLDDGAVGQLSFDPGEASDKHLPLSLATPQSENATVKLPVIIHLQDGSSLQLVASANATQLDKTFWSMLKEKLEKWTPLLSEEGFTPFGEIEKRELAVLADLLPDLLGQNGRIVYQKGNDRINKKDYRPFLESVRDRVNGLLETCKQDLVEINARAPMTRQRIAADLQAPLSTSGTQTMTVHEHSIILSGMAKFYGSAVETLRRELVGYGAVISNVAAVAQRQRMEVSAVARCLITDPNSITVQPAITANTASQFPTPKASAPQNDSTATKPNPNAGAAATTTVAEPKNATNPKPNAGAAVTTTKVAESKNATLADNSANLDTTTPHAPEVLPTAVSNILVKFVEAHACLCEACDPQYHQQLQANLVLSAQDVYKATLREEVKSDVKREIKQENEKDWASEGKREAREDYERGVLDRVKQNYKDELVSQVQQEWKATERDKIKSEVRAEYAAKQQKLMAALMV